MTDVKKSSTFTDFSVLFLITFLMEIDILALARLIYLDGDEGQVSVGQVL